MQAFSNDGKTYVTEPGKVTLFDRIFPSWGFYPRFFEIILRSSRQARLGTYDDTDWGNSSLEVLRALEKVGVRVETSGLEHVRQVQGPVLIVGNHLSVLETTVLPALIVPYRPVTYVIKESLLDVPVFKHIMRSRDPIAVTRTNPRQDLKVVFEQGCERLSKNVSIIIFPQTTRAPFDPGQFSSIAIKLARKAEVPVVPLALLTDAWGNGRWMKDFGKIDPAKTVHFAFGKPLYIQGKGVEEHQVVIDFIQEKLSHWQAVLDRKEPSDKTERRVV